MRSVILTTLELKAQEAPADEGWGVLGGGGSSYAEIDNNNKNNAEKSYIYTHVKIYTTEQK